MTHKTDSPPTVLPGIQQFNEMPQALVGDFDGASIEAILLQAVLRPKTAAPCFCVTLHKLRQSEVA